MYTVPFGTSHMAGGATIVQVDCASNNTHLTNFSGDKYAWPMNLKIGNIWKDIHWTPIMHSWILVGLNPCAPKGAKNTDEAWQSTVGSVLSPHQNVNITGPGSHWDCADGFQTYCHPLSAALVGDYPEQVTVAQLSYGLCLICENPEGVLMGHSMFQPLNHSGDQYIYQELLDTTNIDVLHTLGVHRIPN